MLFALYCPERVSSLSKLDLRYCRVAPEGVSFILTTVRKRCSKDQLPQAFFASYPHNKRLCPVDTLRHYLKATREVRPVFPSSKPDPLFISYVKPHKPIASPTLSRWLCTGLTNLVSHPVMLILPLKIDVAVLSFLFGFFFSRCHTRPLFSTLRAQALNST